MVLLLLIARTLLCGITETTLPVKVCSWVFTDFLVYLEENWGNELIKQKLRGM